MAHRTRINALALALVGLGTLVGFLSLADFDPPALGRKERAPRHADDDYEDEHDPGHEEAHEHDFMPEARHERDNDECIYRAVHRLLEARAECESTYTTCIFACTGRTSGADNAACVLACVQSTANCSSAAEHEMEQAWLACRGGVQSAHLAETIESACIEDAVHVMLEEKKACEVNFTKCEDDAATTVDDDISTHADDIMECVRVSAYCTTEAEAELTRKVRACHQEDGQSTVDSHPMMPTNKTLVGSSNQVAVASNVHKNEYCVGNTDEDNLNPDRDGNGFICKKALLKPKCETHEQLASLFCACCYCYRQCNMRQTEWIGCRTHINCDV